jgi:PAS domain S-box-containing protein
MADETNFEDRVPTALLRSMLESTAVGIVVFDSDGTALFYSPGAARMFGYSADEVLGRNVNMLVPAEYWTAHDNFVAHFDHTGQELAIESGEMRARTKEGESFRALVSVAPFKADGQRMFVVFLHQLTGTPELEDAASRTEAQVEQAQRLESLGQLAGGIAHDFNNILAAIGMHAEMAIDTVVDQSDAHRDLEQITAAVAQGRGLTRQLLAFGKREVAHISVVDINDLVRSVDSLLQPTLGEQVELSVSLADDLATVRVDRSQLEQVLVNLAVNARDAMPEGGELRIETSNVDVGGTFVDHPGLPFGSYVRLSIADDGEGMTPEVRARAFEPFFTTRPQGSGSGLGLATVYGIVTQAGGTVTIYSEVGIGTVVSVLLPAADNDTKEDGPSVASTRPRGFGETVLVVEDEANIRTLLERLLGGDGYDVLVAADGTSGLELARRHAGEIALLLTDVVMPHMSGPELARTLLGERPDLRVVFMSGYTQGILGTQGFESDAALLEKPFTRQALLEAVASALSD